MALNKLKLKRKTLIQISLVFFGLLIIFFTYFYIGKKDTSSDKVEEKKIEENITEKEGFNTFENIPPTSVSEDPGPLQNERSQISEIVRAHVRTPVPLEAPYPA